MDLSPPSPAHMRRSVSEIVLHRLSTASIQSSETTGDRSSLTSSPRTSQDEQTLIGSSMEDLASESALRLSLPLASSSPLATPRRVHYLRDSVRSLPLFPSPSTSTLDGSPRTRGPRPRASLTRVSSLDALMTFWDERAQWDREAAQQNQQLGCSRPPSAATVLEEDEDDNGDNESIEDIQLAKRQRKSSRSSGLPSLPFFPSASLPPYQPSDATNRFRSFSAEVGFCITIALTQFLAEYLISGFAIALPQLMYNHHSIGPGSTGYFWPATLLSLCLSATLLLFARLSDLCGGYHLFISGVLWLAIWTLIPGLYHEPVILQISRAMQGLAIAAYMPSTFTMIGAYYPEGRRKNFVLGCYAGCAPVGFFMGFLVAGALPSGKQEWYFFIAAALAFITVVTAYMSIPRDLTDRQNLGLKMDYAGSFFIIAGLMLVSYALAASSEANQFDKTRSGFGYPSVYGPLVSGGVCLGIALWVEGWWAECPLLPFDFFQPRGVIAFALAGLCFYASYGVWLYTSASFFQSPTGTTSSPLGINGVKLAMYYVPTAIGGLLLCIFSGKIVHCVSIQLLLLISGAAWIAAPLLLALTPLPTPYWPIALPSMLCATLGIDLTFTVSIVFLSAVQPVKYQGLAGAVSSVLVNMGIAFSLPISEIIRDKAELGYLTKYAIGNDGSGGMILSRQLGNGLSATNMTYLMASSDPEKQLFDAATNFGFRMAFFYGTASAALGFLLCLFFVRIPNGVVSGDLRVDQNAQMSENDAIDREMQPPSSRRHASNEEMV